MSKQNQTMIFRTAVLILLLRCMGCIAGEQASDPVEEKPVSNTPEEIFRHNFIQRRVEQLSAVKKLHVTENAVDQYKMISIMAQKLFSVLQETKEALSDIGYFHGASKLPKDLREQEVLTHFLENTAILCDFLIFMPEATKRLLMFNLHWRILLIDSIEFASSFKFLDEGTLRQLQQASSILAESHDNKNFSSEVEGRNQKKKKERKKPKRGPRLSVIGSSAGEL